MPLWTQPLVQDFGAEPSSQHNFTLSHHQSENPLVHSSYKRGVPCCARAGCGSRRKSLSRLGVCVAVTHCCAIKPPNECATMTGAAPSSCTTSARSWAWLSSVPASVCVCACVCLCSTDTTHMPPCGCQAEHAGSLQAACRGSHALPHLPQTRPAPGHCRPAHAG